MISGALGQNVRIDSFISTISSATAAPIWVSMEDADRALFVVSMGTAAAGLQSAITVLESSVTTAAGSAIAGATAVIGSTSSTRLDRVKQAIITISSASTDNNLIRINGTTYTQSTANTATSLQFGSTAGTTSAAGLDDISHALSSRINANQAYITATTISTLAVRISLDDTASTFSLDVNADSANHTFISELAWASIEIKASDLATTSKYVALNLGTVATAIRANVTVLRYNNRYDPAPVRGTASPLTVTS